MNIHEPAISRELASLMQGLRLTARRRVQFIRGAYKAKDMEDFKKDLRSGAIYEEPIPPLPVK